ncbi:MAG: LysM peptidoglycan-binding domain-containing protein [Anaerolineae bacterium]|nr:LysM peptidoglycan-binding domain-containing protein [Anaerolineae bacterium]
MSRQQRPFLPLQSIILFVVVSLLFSACERPDPQVSVIDVNGENPAVIGEALAPVPPDSAVNADIPPTPIMPEMRLPTRAVYEGNPTPDPPHTSPVNLENGVAPHVVNPGETLAYIAQIYGVDVADLEALNGVTAVDVLQVGQEIMVPSRMDAIGPSFKIIPDSELVYGPAAKGFDVAAFAGEYGGFLLAYTEEIEGTVLTGPQVVQLIADRFSVNPRLLLAALEYSSGWVTNPAPPSTSSGIYPLGYIDDSIPSLYWQLYRAANQLNWGYYGRSEAGMSAITLADETKIAFAPDINDGTAGVQTFLAGLTNTTYDSWLQATGATGFFATYDKLFGNPFAYTVDPLWPSDLRQPPLQLPFTNNDTWYFTGGPHGGWGAGSAWAALDFVPPDVEQGCLQSEAWVTAMADGKVVRSDKGAVVVDADGDGYAGTGWAILYMHLEGRDRIPVGTFVQTGDQLGHAACEGGFSNGTHVHVARLYNGRWVSADGPIPFEMAGWVSQGLQREYDGLLIRGGIQKEACDICQDEINSVTAD